MVAPDNPSPDAASAARRTGFTSDTQFRPSTIFQRIAKLVLGTDTKQRGYLKMLLLTVWIYVIAIGLLAFGVSTHLFDRHLSCLLAACCICSTATFYIVMRSGLNKRFSSPTLVVPQTLAAQTWIVFAYAITGSVHGSVLIMLAMVMVFGMFNMSSTHARRVALYTTALIGVVMWVKSTVDPLVYVPQVEFVHFVLAATAMLAIAQLAAKLSHMSNRLKAQKGELEHAMAHIQSMAIHDELTGLVNRRHLRQVIDEHIQRQMRGGQGFYLALLDLDHFKQINDKYGHHTGDEVLISFSRLVMNQLRTTDMFGRWGGEEFLLLCLDPKPESATICLTRLQSRLQNQVLCGTDPALRITFSAGMTKCLVGESVDDAIDRADKGLYSAKAAGRNITIVL